MKYFLISNMYPTSKNPGYGVFVKNIVTALSKYDFTVSCKSLIYGKPYNTANKLWRYIVFYFSIICNYFKTYDFIYLHFPNQAIPILSILYKIKKVPIVINFHGEDLIYPQTRLWKILGRRMEKFVKLYATGIVVPSTYYKNIVCDKHLTQSNKIIVSPSGGINPSNFQICKTNKSGFRIGFIGRLEEDKGIWEFIQSYKELSKELNIMATIIGYGSCYNDVKQEITNNNLEKTTEIINGIKQQELCKYYSSLDLFIFPSKRITESLGLTGIEAMACGVPVIGSNIGGIPSYLKDGENGFLVSPGNTQEIVSAIKQYMFLPENKKAEMIQNCRITAAKYHNNVVALQLSNSFLQLLS